MKALLLVGGMGTRLRPLTDGLPKPMVPVMGKPLLARTLQTLKRHGVDEIVLSTCYKSEAIRSYFKDGSDFGLKIHYVDEDFPLGTGGAIKNCEKYFDDSFFVLNADILSNIDFSGMMRYHKRKKADITIAVTRVANPSAYGVIEYDKNSFVTSFREKPKKILSHYINAGIYIFEPKVLRQIPSGQKISVEREVFPGVLENKQKIAVYKGCHYWIDIGTLRKYAMVHRDGFTGRYQLPEVNFRQRAIYSQLNAKISGSATLRGPVYLGAGAQIGDGAIVGPHVVVGNNSIIGNKCAISYSVLWDNIHVASGVKMDECIVTNGCYMERSSYCHAICTPDIVKNISYVAI